MSLKAQGNGISSEPFFARRVLDDVWVIAEPPHVNMWLILGRDRAVLVDSGLGIAPLRPLVEAITELPVLLVNSHAHFDHVGGNGEFDSLAAGSLTAELLVAGTPPWVLQAYSDGVADFEIPADDLHRVDLLGQYTPEFVPRPWPGADGWSQPGRVVDRVLAIGDRIDLGDRELTVLSTPGHSEDSITLLDERRGHAYAGDLINRGMNYGHLPDSDLGDYLESVGALRAVRPTLVFSNHWPRPIADLAMLDELDALLRALLDGSAPLDDTVDDFGQPAKIATLGVTSMTVADPSRPPRSILATPPAGSAEKADEDALDLG